MDEPTDLGATIRAAAAELSEAPQEAPQQQTPAEPVADAPEPEVAPEAPETGRKRAPDGKFAKTTEQEETTPVQPEEVKDAPSDAPRPPAAWKAQAKHDWSLTPPSVQQEILRREGELNEGFAQSKLKSERVNRFDAIVAPHKEKLALNGTDEFKAIEQLFAAQSYLERDPVNAILYLAKSYGVDPSQLAQPAGQQVPYQAPQYDQALHPILQELNTLKQTVTAQQRRDESARLEQMNAEIARFASDPEHVYFENVQEDMGLLIEQGRAKTLSEAYDMAVYMRPDIRALVQADNAKREQAKALEAQRAKAEQARKASGSINGAPGAGGSVSTNPAHANRTLRETIEASAQQASGRA